MTTKTCPVCKKQVEIVKGIVGNHGRLSLHGPGKDLEFWCQGSYDKVKLTPKQKKNLK